MQSDKHKLKYDTQTFHSFLSQPTNHTFHPIQAFR